MDVKIIISGLGVGFGWAGFGANAFSGAYLQTRVKQGAPVDTDGIVSSFSLGSDSSTIIVGHVATNWFPVDKKAEKFLSDRSNLPGKIAGIEAIDTRFLGGKADIKFTVFDDIDKGHTIIDLIGFRSSGGPLAATKVRGPCKGISSTRAVAQ